MSLFRDRTDWLARRRAAVVAGRKVTVQVRNGVAEHPVVQLVRLEDALEGLSAANDVPPEFGACVLGRFVWLADVPLTCQYAVALHVPVSAETETAAATGRRSATPLRFDGAARLSAEDAPPPACGPTPR